MNKLYAFLVLLLSLQSYAALDTLDTDAKVVNVSKKTILVDHTVVKPVHFESKFKEKYNTKEFQYEVKISEKSWWDRFVLWLNQLFKDAFGLSDGVSSAAVNWSIKIVATLIVLLVIYLIAKSILNKEGQWIFGKSTSKKIISHDDIERNLKHVDFEKLIKETLKAGDKRLAVRYYYLWILKKMSEKSIIEWNPEKTNSDYLYEIKSNELRRDFGYVSYLYNYIWYGEFDLDELTSENALLALEKTLKSI